MAHNPHYKTNAVLGISDAAWATLKAKVDAYLAAHVDQEEILDDTLRALDVALADDRTWNQLKSEMGL